MQETITQASTQLTAKWEGLTKQQKIKIGIGIGAVVMIIVLGVLMLSKPKMQVLYRNLDLKDAAEVVAVLDDQKISYNVIDDGRTIQVNSKELSAIKLVLAKENIPKSSYTFDDAITNSMSTTEQEKQAKMNEYKKAEVEKALESMDAISKANVTLEIPQEKNSFLASKQKSSASVMLELRNSLSRNQIEGVARFISSSVENLDMENITIIDTEGNSLFMGETEGDLSISKQQELKQVAEQSIKTKITELLEPLYDEVRISPNLVLDFNQHEEVREEYIPLEEGETRGIIQNESSVTSSSTNMQSGAEPGVTNNGGDTPTYQVGGTSGGESKSTSKDIQYANNKVVSNSVKNIGDIDYQNSSVAVHVFKNKIYNQELIESTLPSIMSWETFKEENKYQVPITIDAAVAESIQKGTGIDNIVVYGYENPVFIDTIPYEIASKDYIPYLVILVVLVAGAFILFRFRRPKEMIDTEPELEIEEMLKVTKQEVELEDIQLKESLETKRAIEKFIDEKPEVVANLLRNWLTEEEWK